MVLAINHVAPHLVGTNNAPYKAALRSRLHTHQSHLAASHPVHPIEKRVSALIEELGTLEGERSDLLVKKESYITRFFSDETWEEWMHSETPLGRVVNAYLSVERRKALSELDERTIKEAEHTVKEARRKKEEQSGTLFPVAGSNAVRLTSLPVRKKVVPRPPGFEFRFMQKRACAEMRATVEASLRRILPDSVASDLARLEGTLWVHAIIEGVESFLEHHSDLADEKKLLLRLEHYYWFHVVYSAHIEFFSDIPVIEGESRYGLTLDPIEYMRTFVIEKGYKQESCDSPVQFLISLKIAQVNAANLEKHKVRSTQS
jgi:hypothetical protein